MFNVCRKDSRFGRRTFGWLSLKLQRKRIEKNLTIFITISANAHNFDKKQEAAVDDMGHAYDFDSVMHYGKFAFAKDRKYTRRESWRFSNLCQLIDRPFPLEDAILATSQVLILFWFTYKGMFCRSLTVKSLRYPTMMTSYRRYEKCL